MNTGVLRMTVITAALVVRAFAGGIDRIDIFDNAGNRLLFVTFEYDSAGNNSGRTVSAGDSTFLRSTRLTKDAGGKVTAENSLDYESNPLFTTRISPQSGRTDFAVNDQFGMDMLGAPMSYTPGAAGEYGISQVGTTLYKQKYEYAGDGSLTRITFTDAAGALLYYATMTRLTGVIPGAIPGPPARLAPVFRATTGGNLFVTVTLAVVSNVTVELFTLSGRLAARAAGTSLAPGRRTIEMACNPGVGGGSAVVRISVNGSPVFHGRLMAAR
jgi:hypothetical protein